MSNRHGLTDAQVLAALYNGSGPHLPGDLGLLVAATRKEMTIEKAEELLSGRTERYFDYIDARVMKIDVSEDPLDFRLYDRDNGQGAGERALLAVVTRPAR